MSQNRKIQKAVNRLIREVNQAEERITIFTEAGHEYAIGFYAIGPICGTELEEIADELFDKALDCIHEMETANMGRIVGMRQYAGDDDKT